MRIESLPSAFMSPTTESVAFFSEATSSFSKWLVNGFEQEGSRFVSSDIGDLEPNTILASLSPRAVVGVNRYLLLSMSDWIAVLNDAKLGTDMGMIPSLAARELGCRAIRATAIEGCDDRFGATILEVFEPEADLPLCHRRTVCAANDGGTWTFSESGVPFSFEDVAAYRRKKIQDRFTSDMLHRYLRELGVPEFRIESLANYSPRLIARKA